MSLEHCATPADRADAREHTCFQEKSPDILSKDASYTEPDHQGFRKERMACVWAARVCVP